MSRPAVDAMLYLLDQAFEGDDEHSLLANLRNVRPHDWAWRPNGGSRSIRAIVRHAGWAKRMYNDHAFGPATASWDDLASVAMDLDGRRDPVGAYRQWLSEGQRALRESLAALTDADLPGMRRTHWGEMMETRRIIAVMIEHDLYHAGEVNHIRALCQSDGTWPGSTP
ncbi:MAG: DinB family protein [Chloroflexi bacterium]|nr:DinB family protein [Chloroflexota bacterium]